MGRHSKPSTTKRNLKRVAVGSAAAAVGTGTLTGMQAIAAPAHAGTLDSIAACESSGNPTAQNATSTASGLYQFLDSSWLAYGGGKYASRAMYATPAQQTEIAKHALAVSGTSPWNASRSCWGSSSAPTVHVSQPAASQPPVVTQQSTQPAYDTGRDPVTGLGKYRCDAAHLYFAACNPHNIGQVVDYPFFDGYHANGTTAPQTGAPRHAKTHTVIPGDTLSGIADANGLNWHTLYSNNRAVIGPNPDLILPGQVLSL